MEGRIKDGHGDLRCESVCFDFPEEGAVCISDCIEFGEAYRVSDTGLEHLTKFDKLIGLNLTQTKVTPDGVEKLRKALPKCAVTYPPPKK